MHRLSDRLVRLLDRFDRLRNAAAVLILVAAGAAYLLLHSPEAPGRVSATEHTVVASGAVLRLDKSVGTHFVRAILVRAGAGETKRIARLGAVVTGLNDAAQVEYTFACGAYTLEISSRPRRTRGSSAPRRIRIASS